MAAVGKLYAIVTRAPLMIGLRREDTRLDDKSPDIEPSSCVGEEMTHNVLNICDT